MTVRTFGLLIGVKWLIWALFGPSYLIAALHIAAKKSDFFCDFSVRICNPGWFLLFSRLCTTF